MIMKACRRLYPLMLLSLLGVPACDEVDDADDPFFGEPAPEEVFGAEWRGWGYGSSGPVLNTNIVNGAAVNTVRLGYPTSYGTEILWIWSPGHQEFLDLATVEVVDGALKGKTEDGVILSALHFEGSVWAMTVNGQAVAVTLEDVRRAEEVGLANEGSKMMTNLDPTRFVYKWSSYAAPAAGTKVDPKTGWGGSYDGLHTCPTDAQGSTWTVMYRALLVNEANGDVTSASWAPKEYAYIACLGGRIGKTAMWGYTFDNPSPAIPDLTLAEFEGAHRMVGAEYCGDSKSWTRAGEAVTILDKWDINEHAGDGASDEAVWTTSGALCVGSPRWEIYSAPILCNNGTTIPSCATYAPLYYGWSTDAKWWTRNAAFLD
jgi:hypothetical protein